MKILGISGTFLDVENHDTAVALFDNGKIVYNSEEERFSRIKHAFGKNFPELSLKKAFEEQNISFEDIDAIGIPHDIHIKENCTKALQKMFNADFKCFHNLYYPGHHTAHIYDSFFQSGFKSAACLVIDGYGDQDDAITLAHFKNNKVQKLKVYSSQVSLGILYTIVSTICGFDGFGEGKLMGLSSYGKPTEMMPFEWKNDELTILKDIPVYEKQQNTWKVLTKYILKNCYPFIQRSSEKDNKDIIYYVNLAASVQEFFNQSVLKLCQQLKEMTNEDNLILSGGCIQNCIGNNLVVESGLFKNVFAAPAPHDAGCAAGLAFYAAHQLNQDIQNDRINVSYTGKKYSDKEILASIDKKLFSVKEITLKDVANLLKENKILAWFQEGSEIGPRALGHRSIIANPSMRENLIKINNLIKNRETWRPLAPTILKEKFFDVFETDSYDLTEFMLRTIIIKETWRKKLIAVCHIDNTSRPQTISQQQNKEFYDLIYAFNEITSIPAIINTSFNRRGEPIIETPEQALDCLKDKTELDAIVFNAKYLVERK